MTLSTLILNIGIVALILTAIIALVFKKRDAIWMTFLQTFCGSLFLFSGWVKAVDPLGTAYKMEQYFAEFNYTFQETAFSFLAPLFPMLSEQSIGFSVIMIVFEIVLGLMLILGARRKFTAWAFLVLTLFFTLLTGFTFLTGYMPSGVNFFSFSEWGGYAESNMRVTDCGCFGDFIKLKPKTSFFKDVFLLIPAVAFIVFNRKMYQLFTPGIRDVSVAALGIVTLIYAFSNYVWDIPHVDFRPFKEGADVRAQFEAELEASENVKIVAWKIKNKTDGTTVEISNDVFMKEWGSKYTSENWEVDEQIKTEPTLELTKISDFEFSDPEGYSKSEELMMDEGTTIMIVCAKLKGESGYREITVQDTVMAIDTIWSESRDSFELSNRIVEIRERKENKAHMKWDDVFSNAFTNVVNPFIRQAANIGVNALGVVGGAGMETIEQLRDDFNCEYPIYEADDILLKTIVRSNPGIVIWKDGKIIKKWHYKKLPNFNEVESLF